MSKRRRFSPKFKQEAVVQTLQRGGGKCGTPRDEATANLKGELARAKEERNALRKAAAFWQSAAQ